MSSIVERTYPMATLGIGRPDHSPKVGAEKLTTGTLQQRLSLGSTMLILAGSISWWTPYTVPAGHKLNIGSLMISCERSLLQRLMVYYSIGGVITYIVHQMTYDMRGQIVYGPDSTIEVPEGALITVVVYNEDTSDNWLVVDINGTLERIS